MKTITTISRITRGIVIPRIRPKLAFDPLSFAVDCPFRVVEVEIIVKSESPTLFKLFEKF
jgi:hypothetical protein